jgi:hypothetical protein
VAETALEPVDTTGAGGEIAGDVDITGNSKRFRCLRKSFDDALAENAEEAAGLKVEQS